MNMSTANTSSLIVDQLITYADWFFPGEIDFDRDLEVGIVNGTETQVVGMRRCISNSSLSDHGESPPQGSPKPAARRKNKPAPTPPNSTTPDKHDRKYEDKPPPAPDKPPRPLMSATLNRVTYKSQKHEVNTELISRHETPVEKPEKNSVTETKHVDNEITTQIGLPSTDCLENTQELKCKQDANKIDTESEKHNQESQKLDKKINVPIVHEKSNANSENLPNKIAMETESIETIIQKQKPVVTEKPSTLERRRPVAAPRSITNIAHSIDDTVELRKKSDGNITLTSSMNDRSSKPAIPERPAGLVRPSSLIRQHPRHSNENLEIDTGLLTLERAHVYSVDKQQVSIIQVRGTGNTSGNPGESNGNAASNLQRSPSVGSRPSSMSLYGERLEKPTRSEAVEQGKAHVRTRSEGNIIDVQTQTETVVVLKSPQQSVSTCPRFHQRPPRPQPPPPPPPTTRPKSDQESTNL